MSEMIERVARAIDPFVFQSWQQSYDYKMEQTGSAEEATAFADWSMGKRVDEARESAKAAIEAMREPTEAMFQEGHRFDVMAIRNTVSIYQAMIDEALK